MSSRLNSLLSDSISVSSSAPRKQHVESIKVTIAVTVYPPVAPEAIVVVAVAPSTIASDVDMKQCRVCRSLKAVVIVRVRHK